MNTFTNNVDGFLTIAHHAVDDRIRRTSHLSMARQARQARQVVAPRREHSSHRLSWRSFRSAPAH